MIKPYLLPFFLFTYIYIEAIPLTIEQQIGQLFIVGAYSNAEDARKEGLQEDPTHYVEDLIAKYQIGGVLFKMRWSPDEVRAKTAYFQGLSQIRLFTCLDAEWGLSQRMVKGEVYPKNYALGTLNDLDLVYLTGKEIGRQCREIGINLNFAPVVDINTNPSNPIINHRSFGSDPDHVASCGIAMMKGLQDGGVLACAKHFPGHGDTEVDSHTGLPLVNHSIRRLESVEYVPFKRLIEQGVECVMGAHLMIPVLDPDLPASLSSQAIQRLLKDEIGFKGLAVTDDLIMGAVTQNYSLEEAVILAFLAGNDLILLSRDVERGIQAITNAIDEGRIQTEEIQARVDKVNRYRKKIAGAPSVQRNLTLQKELYRSLIKGEVVELDFIVQVGGVKDSCYKKSTIDCLNIGEEIPNSARRVALVIFDMEPTIRTKYGIKKETVQLVQNLIVSGKDVTVILHGDPEAAKLLPEGVNVIAAFDDSIPAQEAVLEVLLRDFNLYAY